MSAEDLRARDVAALACLLPYSPLGRFAATGEVPDPPDLLYEEVEWARAWADDPRSLNWLAAYVAAAGPRGPVRGWLPRPPV